MALGLEEAAFGYQRFTAEWRGRWGVAGFEVGGSVRHWFFMILSSWSYGLLFIPQKEINVFSAVLINRIVSQITRYTLISTFIYCSVVLILIASYIYVCVLCQSIYIYIYFMLHCVKYSFCFVSRWMSCLNSDRILEP